MNKHLTPTVATPPIDMISTTCSVFMILCCGAADEDLRCLDTNPPAAKRIYSQLQKQAYSALDRRNQAVEKLTTTEQIRAYQKSRKEFFVRQLGGFPRRTPLKAQVVGKLSGQGYRAEKIIFQSQPDHHVTAILYLPAGKPPYPGVVVASGHSRSAKAAGYNQRFGIALATNGIAAICYDPIGQGERSQLVTSEGKPRLRSTTREHSLMGIGSILVGRNTASYRVWDGIRTIDYLTSRPDIDAKRIGFTGCSGGGTLTCYVMACDERVWCAAPSCYLTNFRRLIETIGPQDAEQNIFGQIQFGLDQPDYVLMRAPRPTLISATTSDFFDIRGSWETYRQAKRFYWRLGHSDRMDLVEGAGGHGVPQQNLTQIVRWMRRWLLGSDDAVDLQPIATHPEKDLQCTEQGQVLLLPNEKSVFELNMELERRLASQRREFWQKTAPQEKLQAVRQVVGVRPLDQIGPLRSKKLGSVDRGSYQIDKLVLYTASEIPIPALLFHPRKPNGTACLYLHEAGKHADAAVGGPIEKIVAGGRLVLAVDLRGFGETAPHSSHTSSGYRLEEQTFFLAYLLGQSITGLRTEDVLACARWVGTYETDKPREVDLVGVGSAGIAALHAAALEEKLFRTLTLRQTLSTWTKMLGDSVSYNLLANSIHGALKVYDLPDLVECLPADRVAIEDAR